MSMKVVFLKDTMDHKAGWEGFIPRSLGRRLCQQEITVPSSIKDFHLGYLEMMKKKRKKPEKEKPKTQTSKKVEEREKAVT